MNRYSSYGQADDPPLIEGDRSLLGTNDWDAAENLQPGQCQSAINMDFTTQDAVTRGGFVCLPALGANPFGLAWTNYANPSSTLTNGKAIAYGNGRFVSVGTVNITVDCVAWSTDGRTWTGADGIALGAWTSICYGNGLFVAAASGLNAPGNYIMTSPDGVTWTGRVLTVPVISVAYGNGRFIALIASPHNYYSTDGITWTLQVGSPYPNDSTLRIAYGNGIFVVTDTAGNSLVTSDGITWASYTGPQGLDNYFDNSQGKALVYYGGYFYLPGQNGIAQSTDGITWSYTYVGWSGLPVATSSGDDLIIVVTSTAMVYTSSDGISWNLRVSPTGFSNVADAAYGNNVFVVFGTKFATTAWGGTLVYASAPYSDPNDIGSDWIMLVGNTTVGFYANGKTPHTVSLGSYTVTAQSTIVQCNNLVYLFRGPDAAPLYWSGSWADEFILVPAAPVIPGFTDIPNSNQATYYQNRLWVVDGKDNIAASDVLDFTAYDAIANNFNLNTGSSDYVVATYPFGENSLVVFKHRSILILQNVQGSLDDVTVTEVTRQVGCIGINAITTVGPDIAYMSDRNINLITLTATNNAVQHKTLPLSRNISAILRRVNWQYANLVSMAYFDNKLFVAVPLDNAIGCNTILVYNFVTDNWFGTWTFAASIGISIQGFAVASYLGLQRLHAITTDGRIFVTGEGQNDISGTTLAEISTSLTTRAYSFDGDNATQRRMWVDLGTNRPTFSVASATDGVSESSTILSNQTYARSGSWIFNDSTYTLTNASDNFNRAYRQDYASGALAAGTTQGLPTTGLQCGTGFLPEATQDYRVPLITNRQGRLSWLEITNTTGYIRIKGVGFENRSGQRSSLVQV